MQTGRRAALGDYFHHEIHIGAGKAGERLLTGPAVHWEEVGGGWNGDDVVLEGHCFSGFAHRDDNDDLRWPRGSLLGQLGQCEWSDLMDEHAEVVVPGRDELDLDWEDGSRDSGDSGDSHDFPDVDWSGDVPVEDQ